MARFHSSSFWITPVNNGYAVGVFSYGPNFQTGPKCSQHLLPAGCGPESWSNDNTNSDRLVDWEQGEYT